MTISARGRSRDSTERTDQARVALELTGERQHGHLSVRVNGVAIELTDELFGAFCTLVDALYQNNIAGAEISRMTIRRLRQAIDGTTGRPGFGKALIVPVGSGCYVLDILTDSIRIDASFRRVVSTGSAATAVAERLLMRCDDAAGAARPAN